MNEPSRSPRTWRDAQIVQLTLVRFREFLREPEALFWVFIFPVLLTAGLGLAFRNRPPDKIAVALVATGAYDDQSIQARAATMNSISERSKEADGVAARVMTLDSAMSALAQNKIAIIAILDSGRRVTYRYDPANEEARRGRLVMNDLLESDYGRENRLTTKGDYITAPGSRYVDFLVPGLLGMNLLGSGVWGLGFALVDLRRKRLLKRLVATPMSRAQFFTSFLLSRLVVLSFEVIALVGFGVVAFHVPLRGSIWALFFIAVFGALSFSGLGLLVGTRAKTVEAVSGLANAIMLPMWVLSGTFFSASHFPDAMQPIVRALPLTAVNDALRANMLQGAPLTALWPQLGVIAFWIVVCYAAALRLFRWR
jgi:ABC-type multidrug transport system permease subunit